MGSVIQIENIVALPDERIFLVEGLSGFPRKVFADWLFWY